MRRPSRASSSIALAIAVGSLLAVGQQWTADAQQPSTAPGPQFTGESRVLDSKDLGVSRRRFEAAARANWHSHEKGQLLFVEDGRMRTQKRGEAIKELGVGESDYTKPNVVHWHGAVPNTHLIQIAVGFGGQTSWMEKVTDDEYEGRKK